MEARIRQAEMADIPNLVAVATEFHQESPVYKDWQLDLTKLGAYMARFIPGQTRFRPPKRAWLVELDDDPLPCGFLFAMISEKPYMPGHTIATDELFFIRSQYRGMDFGYMLTDAYLEWAERDATNLILMGATSGISPGRTQRFYEKAGFKPIGMIGRFEYEYNHDEESSDVLRRRTG